MHKLILIGGMSTTGKLTTSQNIFKQLQLNNIPSIWLHEESSNHPIRQGEFELGDLHTQEGLNANLNEMLRRWKNLSGKSLCYGRLSFSNDYKSNLYIFTFRTNYC